MPYNFTSRLLAAAMAQKRGIYRFSFYPFSYGAQPSPYNCLTPGKINLRSSQREASTITDTSARYTSPAIR